MASKTTKAAQPVVHKVIMVGSGGVGKSALTLQFMYDEVRRNWSNQNNRNSLCIVFFPAQNHITIKVGPAAAAAASLAGENADGWRADFH